MIFGSTALRKADHSDIADPERHCAGPPAPFRGLHAGVAAKIREPVISVPYCCLAM
jgi:hypothetical protein